jgi:hypothetical protein
MHSLRFSAVIVKIKTASFEVPRTDYTENPLNSGHPNKTVTTSPRKVLLENDLHLLPLNNGHKLFSKKNI